MVNSSGIAQLVWIWKNNPEQSAKDEENTADTTISQNLFSSTENGVPDIYSFISPPDNNFTVVNFAQTECSAIEVSKEDIKEEF